MGRWLSTDPGGAVVHVKERQDVSDALGKWSREDTMPWFYRCVPKAEGRRRQGGGCGREGGVWCTEGIRTEEPNSRSLVIKGHQGSIAPRIRSGGPLPCRCE